MSTIKVRIAIAIDPQGRWYCYGSGTLQKSYIENHDQLLETTDYETIGPGEALHWLVATLPIPRSDEIAAEVMTAPQEDRNSNLS